jgi:small subunit ribosomal protein S17e
LGDSEKGIDTKSPKLKNKTLNGDKLGRLKSTQIKRFSQLLLRKYPDRFSTNFENNKTSISELTDIESKKIKDQMAGYITKIRNSEKEK